MLTRLKVRGFKNLVEVDLRFGPFTCIAGPNGVGKSNIFDAIQFLSALADKTLLEASTGVRQETSSANAGRIFSRGRGCSVDEMHFEAEMLVPRTVRDDLDQEAKATTTSLRYTVGIKLQNGSSTATPRLQLMEEKLDYITQTAMLKSLPYAKRSKPWTTSVLLGRRTSPFISTEVKPDGTFVKVHEDSGHQGRSQQRRADTLPRTLLSTINTAENPTALAARREMQSWRLLQLEPTKLRASDDVNARPTLGQDGSHLAATFFRLITSAGAEAGAVRTRIANRLAELIDDVREVTIDRDEKRELLTLLVSGSDGIEHRARDLSDGTLRFLALSVLEADPLWKGLICMEEPENGIHPLRISAMLHLLESIAVDTAHPVDDTNPLRQVICNTHSPDVVGLSREDAIMFASATDMRRPEGRYLGLVCRPVAGTWRDAGDGLAVSKGEILEFLKAMAVTLRKRDVSTTGSAPLALRPELREQLSLPFTDQSSNSTAGQPH